MPGKYCCVCGNNRSKDPHISSYRFPNDQAKRLVWLEVFQMRVEEIKSHMRVCSRHFPDGDASKHPNPTLGKRLSSPIKKREPRAKRAREREQNRQLSISISPTPTGSRPDSPVQQHALLTTPVGEQLQSDYSVHELPSECTQPSNISYG